jgi:hypothetical protein
MGDYVDYAKAKDRRAANREARHNPAFKAQLDVWKADKNNTFVFERHDNSPTIGNAKPSSPGFGPPEIDMKTGTDLLHVYYSVSGSTGSGGKFGWRPVKINIGYEKPISVNPKSGGDFTTEPYTKTVKLNPAINYEVNFSTASIPDALQIGTDAEPSSLFNTEDPSFATRWVDPIGDATNPQQGFILNDAKTPILRITNATNILVTINPNGAVLYPSKSNPEGIARKSYFNVNFKPVDSFGNKLKRSLTIFYLPTKN